MPAKNPRVTVVLEKGLYSTIHEMAANEGISMSLIMRDMVKEALEIREDMALAEIAEKREQIFDPGKALSHCDL
jgi:metal-responsive CopG/Arc/MetJ family transcriptional regulator